VGLGGWFAAVAEVLDPLLQARMLLALIEAAHSIGLLEAAHERVTVEQLSRRTGLTPALTAEVCDALVANGVLEGDDDRFQLSRAWQVVLGPWAFSPVPETLTAGAVRAATLRSLAAPSAYWTLDDADRYAYARAFSPDPFSRGVVDAFRSGTLTDPAVFSRLRAGGKHLELGCGLAGRILCLLQAHPAMTAVAVELSPDLAAAAQRRAVDLGVSDRLEVIVGDAAQVDVGAGFATAQWSQFFFPEASRAGTLRTLLAALDPTGIVEAPVMGDDTNIASDPTGTEARDYTLKRIVHSLWGIPERTQDQLMDEFVQAGFTDVHAVRLGLVRVFATRP
jgi:protein-L-isoaspartate O-methyltransferase